MKYYKKEASTTRHGYGEYISSVNFESRVFEEINRDHFVEGLAKFLLDGRFKFLDEKKKRSSAFDYAKKIYAERTENISLSNEKIISLVSSAISEGYIWKFKLEEPWHPAIYYNEERISTVPWQHEKAVFYTGRNEYEFFSRKGCQKLLDDGKLKIAVENSEELHNADSVLRKGFISPGVRWASDPQDAQKKVNDDADNEANNKAWSIYLGSKLPTATYYAKKVIETSPVLEVEVPTKFIQMPVGTNDFVRNLEDFYNYFDSPKGMTRRQDEFQYAHRNERKKPKMPLDYINGVWDTEMTDKPYFIPLEDYVKRLYDKDTNSYLPPTEEIRLRAGAEIGNHRRTNYSEDTKELIQDLSKLSKTISYSYSAIGKLVRSYNSLKDENVEGFSTRDSEFQDILGYSHKINSLYLFIEEHPENNAFKDFMKSTTDFERLNPLEVIESAESFEQEFKITKEELEQESYMVSRTENEEKIRAEAKNIIRELKVIPLIPIRAENFERLIEEISVSEQEREKFLQFVKQFRQ